MEEASKLGPMKPSTSDNTKMAKNTEKESSCGLMIVLTKAISMKTTFMVSENTNGKMEGFMKANGKTTKCKEREPSLGQMDVSILAITSRIERKDLVSSHSKTAGYMKANGLMESNMGEEFSRRRTFRGKDSGKTEKELNGWTSKNKTGKSKDPKRKKKETWLQMMPHKYPENQNMLHHERSRQSRV